MRQVPVVVWLLGVMLFQVQSSFAGALRCTVPSIEADFRNSKTVFEGEFLKWNVELSAFDAVTAKVTFKVINIYKGIPSQLPVVLVWNNLTDDPTPLRSPAAQLEYEMKSHSHIYFVKERDQKEHLFIGTCGLGRVLATDENRKQVEAAAAAAEEAN